MFTLLRFYSCRLVFPINSQTICAQSPNDLCCGALREQPLCYMGTASVPHGNSHCAAWEHAAWEQSPVAWEQPLHGNNHCAACERAAWEQTPAAWEQPPCCMGTATMLHGNSHHAARDQPPCYTGTATMLHGNSHCATATMLPAEWEPYMFTC